jgi:hypothetical protein
VLSCLRLVTGRKALLGGPPAAAADNVFGALPSGFSVMPVADFRQDPSLKYTPARDRFSLRPPILAGA